MTFFNDQQTNLSRRSLLKGLGACAALPLLGALFPKHALAQAISTALEQFPTLVPAQKGILTGAHWGAFEAIVADGRMVRVQPVADPESNDTLEALAGLSQTAYVNLISRPGFIDYFQQASPVDRRGAYYRWLFFGAGPVEQAVTSKAMGWTIESS